MNEAGDFDVIIVGGGAAGLSAALWCDELKLKALLLESASELGGQLLWTYNPVENHLGLEAANGKELRDTFVRQIKKRRFTLQLDSDVKEINPQKKSVLLDNGDKFSARALIIATGIKRKTLGIEGENRFKNNGILKSGKRDKEKAMDKKVLIVGGGDAALENSLILSETASKVYIAHRRKEFRARDEFVRASKEKENVEFLRETVLKKIVGEEKIERVELENISENKLFTLPVDLILFRIGVEPNTKFLDNQIELDKKGYIKIDVFCRTNIEGIYAVGDVGNPVSPTVSSAVGMGATAVKAIYSWLN